MNKIVKFPVLIGVIGAFLLLIDFRVINLFSLSGEGKYEEVLQTQMLNADDAKPRMLTSNKLALSLSKTPIGSLGPAKTSRHHSRYYDTLYFIALQFGHDAKSLIEVGCASSPFIKYLDWVDERTCVAPYFVQYGGNDGGNKNTKLTATTNAIVSVVADFMEYEVNDYSFDLLICSQVLEHVPDPAAFMKKLIRTAKTAIISVPYKWPDCGKECNHKTDKIDYDMILEWSEPHQPIYSAIIEERLDGKKSSAFRKRIILVYQQE